MSLQALLDAVLQLQTAYSSANTPQMAQRGLLIRREIPKQLATFHTQLSKAAGLIEGELLIEGRDATGLKSEIPWVRIASREHSPKATTGWYLVCLFRRDGAGFYLALAHGSTEFRGGSFVPRNDSDLKDLTAWGRAILLSQMNERADLVTSIDLASRGPLAIAYQKSCVAALYYPRAALPSDSDLFQDLLSMVTLLGDLYTAETLGQTPGSPNPEVRDAESVVAAISRPSSSGAGQGIGLTVEERRAVEHRAMHQATVFLTANGFAVRDVSKIESFDLLAIRGSEQIRVEVKGTTGGLSSVLLTANEVEMHRAIYPNNALVVVHSIQLLRINGLIGSSGGDLVSWLPWKIKDENLRAITYSYRLPPP